MKCVLNSVFIFCISILCMANKGPYGWYQDILTKNGIYQGGIPFFVTSPDGLNMRDKPGKTGRIIMAIAHGTPVLLQKKDPERHAIQGRSGNWYKVNHLGTAGWVFSGWLCEYGKQLQGRIFEGGVCAGRGGCDMIIFLEKTAIRCRGGMMGFMFNAGSYSINGETIHVRFRKQALYAMDETGKKTDYKTTEKQETLELKTGIWFDGFAKRHVLGLNSAASDTPYPFLDRPVFKLAWEQEYSTIPPVIKQWLLN